QAFDQVRRHGRLRKIPQSVAVRFKLDAQSAQILKQRRHAHSSPHSSASGVRSGRFGVSTLSTSTKPLFSAEWGGVSLTVDADASLNKRDGLPPSGDDPMLTHAPYPAFTSPCRAVSATPGSLSHRQPICTSRTATVPPLPVIHSVSLRSSRASADSS